MTTPEDLQAQLDYAHECLARREAKLALTQAELQAYREAMRLVLGVKSDHWIATIERTAAALLARGF